MNHKARLLVLLFYFNTGVLSLRIKEEGNNTMAYDYNEDYDDTEMTTQFLHKATIITVTPNQLQRTTARTLELVIENFPLISLLYVCEFSVRGRTLFTNATRTPNGVNCPTPRTDLLPSIPFKLHHIRAKLSVSSSSEPITSATNIRFFDCNTYNSCTQCVSSAFPCDWCIERHRCTHDTAMNCRNDNLITGISRTGRSSRSGPTFCPAINSTFGKSPKILISSGTLKSVEVNFHNRYYIIIGTRLVCLFNIEGRITSVRAHLLGDTISCDPMEFTYNSRASNITATFAVIWGGSNPLDNPENIHVEIYRCRDMANNCGTCLALSDKYDCGWCQTPDSCEVQEQCENSDIWLNSSQTCPIPEIHSFSPQLGPTEGGTNITIQGINLREQFGDSIRHNQISIAGIDCQPYDPLHVKIKEIVCQVNSYDMDVLRPGPVIVQVENYRGKSKSLFRFVNPIIEGISPNSGPISGGTKLTITGEFLNAGSTIQAFINDLPCEIISIEPHQAMCETSASKEPIRDGRLRMIFDKGERFFSKEFFEYVEERNPSIYSVESGVPDQTKVLKGIPAGGIKISVTGKDFSYIKNPSISIYYKQKIFISPCAVLTDRIMTCSSPVIEVDDSKLDAEEPMQLQYVISMDFQNISRDQIFQSFFLFPNPIYEPFIDDIKYFKSDYLTINGQHLDSACQESDVVVQIGNQHCNITSLSRQQLTCRLPDTQPLAVDDFGRTNEREPPEVIVIVGGTLKYTIGKLSYSLPQDMNQVLSNPVLIGVIVTIVIFVILLIIFKHG